MPCGASERDREKSDAAEAKQVAHFLCTEERFMHIRERRVRLLSARLAAYMLLICWLAFDFPLGTANELLAACVEMSRRLIAHKSTG